MHSFAGKPLFILDAMSDPGKLGLEVLNVAVASGIDRSKLSLIFNDVRYQPLAILEQQGFATLRCNVTNSGLYLRNTVDLALVRYGIKDLPMEMQLTALKSIHATLAPGGRIVIGDMVAHTKESQSGIIKVHSAKQQFAGRDISKEGECYIPTHQEWSFLLQRAGFSSVKTFVALNPRSGLQWIHLMSEVETSQWKGQFGEGADEGKIIRQMNQIISAAAASNEHFMKECDVKVSGLGTADEKVTLSFPLVVMVGVKE